MTVVQEDNRRLVESVVAACSQPEIITLKVNMGACQAPLAVDTGADASVLSEKTFKALKRVSRGGRYQRRLTDLSLCGVTTDRLNTLGVVRLPESREKHPCHAFGFLRDVKFIPTV